jgi:hypothetical protein
MTLRACSCVRVNALSRKVNEEMWHRAGSVFKSYFWVQWVWAGAFVVRRGLLTGPQAQALLLRWRPATAGTAALASLLQTFSHARVIFFKLLFLIIVQNGVGF